MDKKLGIVLFMRMAVDSRPIGLYSEFYTSLHYKVRPYLRKQNTTKQQLQYKTTKKNKIKMCSNSS